MSRTAELRFCGIRPFAGTFAHGKAWLHYRSRAESAYYKAATVGRAGVRNCTFGATNGRGFIRAVAAL